MKILSAVLFMLMLATGHAMATATMSCQADRGITIYIQVGLGEPEVVTGVDIVTPATHWSTYDVEAEQIAIAQAFISNAGLQLDVADSNYERIIAKVRLVAAEQGADVAIAGTLEIVDGGVFAIVCEGP